MAIVPNIRVNTNVPFPALVQGSGPITITKQNGVWIVGFSITAFGSQSPPIGNFPTDFLLGYDTVANQYFKISLTNLIASISTGVAQRTQRSVINATVTLVSTDQILNLNLNAPQTIVLPSAASRLGNPLTFIDVGGKAFANNISWTLNGADVFYAPAAPKLSTNFQSVTLIPMNDGVTPAGWYAQSP